MRAAGIIKCKSDTRKLNIITGDDFIIIINKYEKAKHDKKAREDEHCEQYN